MEIRIHGRGGQGGVTCAKILAVVYARMGKHVQAFGDYAGERSGAPVRAYTRVDDSPISNRNKVYEPDHLLVLDPTLLGEQVVAGLAPGGTLLVNTIEAIEAIAQRFPTARVATVDATAIAREHGIGTRSVVIVNTTIAGAFARAVGMPFEVLEAAYTGLRLGGNLGAARQAFDAVVIHEPGEIPSDVGRAEADGSSPWGKTGTGAVPDLPHHVEGPAPALKTGAWRSQMPRYISPVAPCSAECPAGNDVVGFIQALAVEDEAQAAELLGATNPLAGVCGRVCPGFCMLGCNRRGHDEAVNIRALERWVGDRQKVALPVNATPKEVREVAIIGGGPAGLSAAYTLTRLGHKAIIYEKEKRPGGVLHTGIPTYRLPRDVLDREISEILSLGIEMRGGENIDRQRLEELTGEHDALILATGLQRLRGLKVPGAELEGVVQGIHFLHQLNVDGKVDLSGHVVVLGGGNTAMDCARSALRVGAKSVTVAYRRTENEMPAIPDEVREAKEEGVEFLFQRAPVAFEGSERITGIQLAEVDMGPPDESGRRSPVVSDRTGTLACDHVLLALGQSVDDSLLPEAWKLEDGRVSAPDRELVVFAAGDLATFDGTVTHAIGDGRKAAGRALVALGEHLHVFKLPDRAKAVRPTDIRLGHFPRSHAHEGGSEPGEERSHTMEEVNHGLPDLSEVERCCSCGHCTKCDTCLVYCPEGIISRTADGYEIDLEYCKGCGVCVVECPRSGMEMISQ